MSAQLGGKKSGGSSNSSMVITPASTPVNTMANGQQASPPPNNAPKYGTLVPNRIFVGGISANTTETELLQLFSNYGTVKAAKIIQDRAGVSKGYGFITFESEDDAKRLQRDQDNIVLRERKLNIAPAIKKQFMMLQPFSRAFDGSSPPAVAPGFAPNFFPPGSMPFFQGGLAYYPQPPSGPADPTTQPPAVFQTPSVYPPQSAPPQAAPYQPVMFPPQPIYMPQQYPMPMPCDYNFYANGGASYASAAGQSGNAQPVIAQGGQLQPPPRSNSPPRQPPPCFTQQMQAAAVGGYPGQDVYYNMPMYPVDSSFYPDPVALEAMAIASGVVPEDCPHQPSDDYSTSARPKSGSSGGGVVMRQPPPPPLSAPPSQPPTPHGCEQRQTATPVVSLLSLDHQQERDLLSMQSGRRRKPPPSTPPAVQVHHGYGLPPPPHVSHVTNGYTPYHPAAVSYDYGYTQILPAYTNSTTPVRHKPATNGWADANMNISGHNSKRYNNAHSSAVYTEFHHGGSVTTTPDDIKQSTPMQPEEKQRRYSQPNFLPRHGQYTPRPGYTYYSSTTNPHLAAGGSGANSRHKQRVFIPTRSQYRNSSRRLDGGTQAPFNGTAPVNGVNNNITTSTPFTCSTGPASEGKACARGLSRSTPPSPGAFVSQMQPVPQQIPQHFVAPARHRSRRTVRRGGGLGECGAGDAPLTNTSDGGGGMGDVCSKIDGLKL